MSDSELGEAFAAYHEMRKQKRAQNQTSSTAMLRLRGVQFEEKKGGVHLVVRYGEHVVDFWPSTGRFIFRESKREGRGVFPLLKALGVGKDETVQRPDTDKADHTGSQDSGL